MNKVIKSNGNATFEKFLTVVYEHSISKIQKLRITIDYVILWDEGTSLMYLNRIVVRLKRCRQGYSEILER